MLVSHSRISFAMRMRRLWPLLATPASAAKPTSSPPVAATRTGASANDPSRAAAGFEYRDNAGYLLKIDGLPWGAASFRTEIWGLDSDDAARRGWGRGGRFRLQRSMPPPDVELIVLRREDAPLSEMIPRRRSR